jgi:hypothetical protein
LKLTDSLIKITSIQKLLNEKLSSRMFCKMTKMIKRKWKKWQIDLICCCCCCCCTLRSYCNKKSSICHVTWKGKGLLHKIDFTTLIEKSKERKKVEMTVQEKKCFWYVDSNTSASIRKIYLIFFCQVTTDIVYPWNRTLN